MMARNAPGRHPSAFPHGLLHRAIHVHKRTEPGPAHRADDRRDADRRPAHPHPLRPARRPRPGGPDELPLGPDRAARRRDARRRPRPGPPRPTSASAARSPTCGGCGTPRWPGASSGSSATSTTSTSPSSTESNYRDLIDKVAAVGRDPAWAPTVLRDRCNIRTVVTSLGNRSADPARTPTRPVHARRPLPVLPRRRHRPDALLRGPDHQGRILRGPLPGPRRSARHHRAATARSCTTGSTGRSRAGSGSPTRSSRSSSDSCRLTSPHTRAALNRRRRTAGPLADADVDALARFVSWEVLAWHHENRKAFQIAVGAEYFICDGKSIPRFQETWTSEMARAFHHFGNARFDLMMASDVLTHEVAVLARQFPNVYASGYWWHNFFPATIEKIIGAARPDRADDQGRRVPLRRLLRRVDLRQAPGRKESDGRRPRAAWWRRAFTRKTRSRPLLQQILHDTPRDLYDLGAALRGRFVRALR